MDKVIDVHVHFGAPGNDGQPVHGCYWSERFERSVAFWAFRFLTGTIFGRMSFERSQAKITKLLDKSSKVDQIVLLALDQVYDRQGDSDLPNWTNLFVDNSAIVDLAAADDRVLFGASVHPYRLDWEEQLDYCLEHKAVLCKWLPSAQAIDPGDPKCDRFYDKLAAHRLPLLCHVGLERSIPTCHDSYNQFNNAKYLVRALDKGVPVIFAHSSLPFEPTDLDQDPDFQDFLGVMADARTNGWQAYADISALCMLRATYIPRLLDLIPADRFLFGSDFPIPMLSLGPRSMPNLLDRLWHLIDAVFTRNLLDKNYKNLEDFDFPHAPHDVFTAAGDLFAQIAY
jgi:predicted TIM-barrel fold metal-dependent hydrolase